MKFATALIVATFSAQQAMAQILGQSCVNGTMVKVFNRINDIRASGTASADTIRYAAGVSGGWSATWAMTQNSVNDSNAYNVDVVSASRISDSNTVM
jgi:hypothetical protein